MNLKLLHKVLLWAILFIGITNSTPSTANDDRNWWKTANYYQIYPKSFQDSDGNGIGDLNGIISRLSYLREIGITATWLSPIFKSPMVDNGYDISNFREIDPIFGTIDDFKKLVAKAHELDIKIILDFVPNHSSDQHEWFKKSVNSEGVYRDYYVWHDGIEDENYPNKRRPPNNWISVFRGSAWTWNEKRQQFYYHQFYDKQPDLNFRSTDVKKAMEDVLVYWLDMEVDGFRIDAVPHIFEHEKFQDEPRNPSVNDPEDYGYLEHIYTYDQDETFEIIYDWRRVLDDYTQKNGGPDRVLLAEAYSPTEVKMRYYGDDKRKGAQFPFNFLLLALNENSTAKDYVDKVEEWMNSMPKGETANWVFGNHDQPRIADRLGRNRTTLANLFILSLPGITVTYYGEEIGMQNIDLEVVPFYMKDARDAERSPMQWNNDISAGFSTNETTWLPVAPDYKFRNVKLQRRSPLSHLNQFKAMAELREKYKFYEHSTFKIENCCKSIIKITRTSTTYDKVDIEILFNVGLHSEEVPHLDKSQYTEVLLINEHSKRRIGQRWFSKNLSLYPNEVLVLKKEKEF